MQTLSRGPVQGGADPAAMELTDQIRSLGGRHHAGQYERPADQHHIEMGFRGRQFGAKLGYQFADAVEINGLAVDKTSDELFVGHVNRSLCDPMDAVVADVISPDKKIRPEETRDELSPSFAKNRGETSAG
jgi:hypothetical protein